MSLPARLLLLCLLANAGVAALPGENRLGRESSPYLLLHRDNPVHWYAWGPEALAAAKAANKPIFLSSGYSSCHWCHVMNRESFADAKTAAILNDGFICIKVDREERPDVDAVYMNAVQAMTGHGGWPMSVFLLPDGRPFFGGTYFPPADKMQGERVVLPGFPTLLGAVSAAWRDHRPALEQQAERLQKALRRDAAPATDAQQMPPVDVVPKAVARIGESFDPVHGGPGSPPRFAPKFPTAGLGLLVLESARADQPELLAPIVLQADRMARGGIVDQIGGGFHRYSVDRQWIIPHFEKMLYDQAQMLSFYSNLHRLRPNPLYRRVVEGIVEFLQREMLSPEGLFYSALDADSEHQEGKFYLWTKEEASAAAGADSAPYLTMIGLEGSPNFEQAYIPVLAKLPEEAAAQAGIPEREFLRRWAKFREDLYKRRALRIRPLRDEKCITAWNALTIVCLADAAEAFKNADWKALATSAADALLAKLRAPDGRLFHQYINGAAKGEAFADDYAASILALLAVGRLESPEAGSAPRTAAAERLAAVLLDRFWDEAGGGFFYKGRDAEALILRLKDDYDGAWPSANSLGALALVELAAATGKPVYRERAETLFRAFRQLMTDSPMGAAHLLRAWRRYQVQFADRPLPTTPAKGPLRSVRVEPATLQFAPGKAVSFKVHIEFANGWHVNANSASAPSLRSLALNVDPALLTNVKLTYPPGKSLKLSEVEAPISVYADSVTIGVEGTAVGTRSEASTLVMTLEFQACDDRRCLAPKVEKATAPIVWKK